MSAPRGCLANLRRHYFATQRDCIHITAHPAKVAGRRTARLATLRLGVPGEGAGPA